MKTLNRILGLAALVFAALPLDAGATNTTYLSGDSNVGVYESASGYSFVIKTPALAAVAADTLYATLDVRKAAVPYIGASSVPTVKYYITTIHSQSGAVTAADSMRIGAEWGFPGITNRSTLVKDIAWITSFLMKTDGSGIPQQDKVLNAKTPTDFAGAQYLRLKICNKHATLARTAYVIVTFPRIPQVEMSRPGL